MLEVVRSRPPANTFVDPAPRTPWRVDAAGKAGFDRARPPLLLRLVAESDASMPSGHTGNSTAFYVSVALVVCAVAASRRRTTTTVVIGCSSLPVAVGLSRLELGMHWPTDVIAGWLLGWAVALVALVVFAIASAGRHQRFTRG